MTPPRRFTIWPWLIIFLMVGSLLWMLNRLSTQVRHADGCEENLRKIHHILTLYELEHGRLPSLEMFPDDPTGEGASLPLLLRTYGMDPSLAVCPAASPLIRDHGLSYLWNTALNEGSLMNRLEPVWVLVDIQALNERTRGPHFGSYHILYSDGRVERSYHPPSTLPVQVD